MGVALGTSIAYLLNGVFRVWHLNRNLTRDEAGQVIGVRQFSEKERGTYRPTSATDPASRSEASGARSRMMAVSRSRSG